MQITIGKNIKDLRKRDNRTQEDLAKALGVTCQAISRWESNGGYPDMELVPAIGKASVENSLKQLVKDGEIQRHGKGKSTFYTRNE